VHAPLPRGSGAVVCSNLQRLALLPPHQPRALGGVYVEQRRVLELQPHLEPVHGVRVAHVQPPATQWEGHSERHSGRHSGRHTRSTRATACRQPTARRGRSCGTERSAVGNPLSSSGGHAASPVNPLAKGGGGAGVEACAPSLLPLTLVHATGGAVSPLRFRT
jgi:hypothetical protein